MATPVQRYKAIIDALANDVVSPPVALQWAQDVWDYYGPHVDENGEPITEPTNVQLATLFIQKIRQYLKTVRESKRAPAIAESARLAAIAAVKAETDSELGVD